jgi:hypothetical protein
MAIDNIISLPVPRKAPLTQAERARNYRNRKKASVRVDAGLIEALAAHDVARQEDVEPRVAVRAPQVLRASTPRPRLKAEAHAGGAGVVDQDGDLVFGQVSHPVTVALPSRAVTPAVTPSRRSLASIGLTATAFALAGVGITMNGWFARSLGASDIAGWLFLAIGVAADGAALMVPSCAARLWDASRRGSACLGWGVWLATLLFALTASIGFASTNIADVTLSRASRITPAVTTAQAQLADAVTARDRECKGGVGKFCREREAVVAERQGQLNAAMASVEHAADPQTEAAIKMVAWASCGAFHPTGDDFNMLRLALLALLPQIGGILLMLARAP